MTNPSEAMIEAGIRKAGEIQNQATSAEFVSAIFIAMQAATSDATPSSGCVWFDIGRPCQSKGCKICRGSMTNPSEAMIGKGVEAYVKYKSERPPGSFNIPMVVATVYRAMQQAATPAAPDDAERFLTAYVSQDTHVIGIEHPTGAEFADVLAAHIALRDRLNVRIAEQSNCPFATPAAPVQDDDAPFTYAHRYPAFPPEGATVIRFGTGGREINGAKPIEAIPLYRRLTPDRVTPLVEAIQQALAHRYGDWTTILEDALRDGGFDA